MATTSAKQVTLSATKEWIMRSRFNGHDYRICVYCPVEEPPAEGFPIIYTLDGNATFAMTTEMIRIQSVRREKTGSFQRLWSVLAMIWMRRFRRADTMI